MSQNPYQAPTTKAEARPSKVTILTGTWRGFRTGVLCGLATAICIFIAVAVRFPDHPLEAIGVYYLFFLPLFLGLVFGAIGAVVGSIVMAIAKAIRA